MSFENKVVLITGGGIEPELVIDLADHAEQLATNGGLIFQIAFDFLSPKIEQLTFGERLVPLAPGVGFLEEVRQEGRDLFGTCAFDRGPFSFLPSVVALAHDLGRLKSHGARKGDDQRQDQAGDRCWWAKLEANRCYN